MGIYLSTPKTEKLSEDGGNARLRFGLSSMQGWRATMEDAHTALLDLDDSTSFFGVYDGHGGKVVSKFCAKYLHTQVLKNDASSADDLGTSLQKAFFRMDEMMRGQRGWRELAVLGDKINKFSGMIEGFIWPPKGSDSNEQHDEWAFEEGPHSDFTGPTAGSTACVAVVRNNQLIVANAGDSRCVISRKGQAHNLSKDHKPELEVEKERILKAGGFIHAGRVNGSLNLARAIGDMEFKQNKFLPAEKQILTANPDITTVDLSDDDEFFVLACDGIWDCMTSQQLVNFIHEHINTRAVETEQRTISPLQVVDQGDQSSCSINPVDVIGNELALVDSLNRFADREDHVTLVEQPPILGHFPDEHDSPTEDSLMVVVGNELALIPCNKPSMEAKMFDHINPGIKRYGQAIVESSIKKARASDESWRCAACDVTTTSEEDLNFHLQGKKHKTSAEQLDMKPTLIMKSDESESSASKLGNGKGTLYMPNAILLQAPGGERSPLKVEVKSQKASKKKGSSVTTVWCEPCKAMCNSADMMEAHLNGKRHKAQMKKLNNGEDGAK